MSEVYLCTDTASASIQQRCRWIAKDGVIPDECYRSLETGGIDVRVYPGQYYVVGSQHALTLGSNATLKGVSPISLNAWVIDPTYPDPATMAVFTNRTDLPQTQEATTAQIGFILTADQASNVLIESIALKGYMILKVRGAKNSTVRNCIVHNYLGKYPDGHFCNMGYAGATASCWTSGTADNVTWDGVASQFSSHHGFANHSGQNGLVMRNIHYYRCRALYSGCGMLRGEVSEEIEDSKRKSPVPGGYGYRDWSVAFDICENATVLGCDLHECVAWSGWKGNFYTEPRGTSGQRTNISLTNCVAGLAGDRNQVTVGRRRYTINKEGECANYYVSTGKLTNCGSYKALKSGFNVQTEQMVMMDGSNYRISLEGCWDIGSPLGIETGAFECRDVQARNCILMQNDNRALRIFGTTNWDLGPMFIVPAYSNRPPVLLGAYHREFWTMSYDPELSRNNDPGVKYDDLRASLTDGKLSVFVAGLGAEIPAVEVASGASWNGTSRWNPEGGLANCSVTRSLPTPLDAQVILQAAGILATGNVVPVPPVDPVDPVDPDPAPVGENKWKGEPSTPWFGDELRPSIQADVTDGPAPLSVSVVCVTPQPATDTVWDWGDGSASYGSPGVHVYKTPGTYKVRSQCWAVPPAGVMIDPAAKVPGPVSNTVTITVRSSTVSGPVVVPDPDPAEPDTPVYDGPTQADWPKPIRVILAGSVDPLISASALSLLDTALWRFTVVQAARPGEEFAVGDTPESLPWPMMDGGLVIADGSEWSEPTAFSAAKNGRYAVLKPLSNDPETLACLIAQTLLSTTSQAGLLYKFAESSGFVGWMVENYPGDPWLFAVVKDWSNPHNLLLYYRYLCSQLRAEISALPKTPTSPTPGTGQTGGGTTTPSGGTTAPTGGSSASGLSYATLPVSGVFILVRVAGQSEYIARLD